MIPFVCSLRICFQIAQKVVAAACTHAITSCPCKCLHYVAMQSASNSNFSTCVLLLCLSKKCRCTGLQVTNVGLSKQHTIYSEELAGIFSGLWIVSNMIQNWQEILGFSMRHYPWGVSWKVAHYLGTLSKKERVFGLLTQLVQASVATSPSCFASLYYPLHTKDFVYKVWCYGTNLHLSPSLHGAVFLTADYSRSVAVTWDVCKSTFQLTSCAFGVLCALAATNVHAP